MSERDFSIGEKNFKLNKIDAMKQFHIVRKIGPILADLLPALKSAPKIQNADMTEAEKFDAFAELAAPLMSGLAKLSEDDADKVLFGLLQSVEVQQAAGNWARIANGQMLMIQDMDLPVLLQIAGRAFAFNLAGFFTAAQRLS